MDSEYKYRDIDVNEIMKRRLKEEKLTGCDIYFLAPIAESEDKFIEFLGDESRNHAENPNRTLLIPYLNGHYQDGHWVGVVVRFDQNVATKVEYYDSLIRPIPIELERNIKTAYGNDVTIRKPVDLIKQDDFTSCGPCMIENMINAAKQNHSYKPTVDRIRIHHNELMQKTSMHDVNELMNDCRLSDHSNDLHMYQNRIPKPTYGMFGLSNAHRSKEYNKRGNEYLSMNDSDKAIAKYNSAIKINPYYAIPYYNKRCAERNKLISMRHQLNEAPTNRNSFADNNQAKTETCFVINTICHAPTKRSFSDDSSDEDIDDDVRRTFEKFKIETSSFPYTANHPKRSKPMNGTMMVPVQTDKKTTKSQLIDRFFKKLSKESFEVFDTERKSCIRVCIALNRMRSVSQRKNKSLFSELESGADTDIEYESFGFFWTCTWYERQTGAVVHYDTVRSFYKQLKTYNKSMAKKFLEQEDAFEQNPENIPYQQLREYAKNHTKTKQFVRELRTTNPNVNIYLSLIDADVVDFNGIFSAYLRIIQDCYEIPTVMTTGYEFPLDPEYGPAHRLQSHMDRMMRVVTASHIPLGTYYPEPNMCILIPKDCSTVPESFIDSRRGNKSESPILLKHIQHERPHAMYIFSNDRPLITSIPARAKVCKAPRARNASKIDFSTELISGKAAPSKYDIEEVFAKVSQSNSNVRNRFKNFFTNGHFDKYFNKDAKRVRQSCESIVSKMFQSKTNEEMISYKNKLSKLMTDPKPVNEIHKAIDERKKYDKYFTKHFERTEEEQEVIDILRKNDIDLDNVSRETILALSIKPMLELIQETDDADPVIGISELIDLDADTLRYISVNDNVIDAFKDTNIDNNALIDLLVNEFDQFDAARYEYNIAEILRRYEENPIHLEFMAGDPFDIVLQNDDDLNYVTIGLDYYDVDPSDIYGSIGSESARCHFELVLNWYNEEKYGTYDDYENYDFPLEGRYESLRDDEMKFH